MKLDPALIEHLAERLHGHYQMAAFINFTGRTSWRNVPEDERVKLRAQVEYVFNLIPDGSGWVLTGGRTRELAKSLHFFAYHQSVNLPTEQCMGEDDLDLDCDYGRGMANDRIRFLMQCFRDWRK